METKSWQQHHRMAAAASGARPRTTGLCVVPGASKPFATYAFVAGSMDALIDARARRLTDHPT